MLAADGGTLKGVIVIERGRLYGKNYQYGGLVDENGRFSVKVTEGGDYGLHLYATGYIYYPVGVEVKTGTDNEFTFTLPPNPAFKDAPVISHVQFEPKGDAPDQMVIKLSVSDPNENLSHQVLGVNIRTQEGFIFSPPTFVFPWTRNYPNGVYTISYDPHGRPFDPREWIFVTADNRCYNSPVLRHPFTQEGVVTAQGPGKPATPIEPTEAHDARSLLERGQKTFTDNCGICHYHDKKETKVGPGLKGLFKKRLTPARKVPVTEENIRAQIQKGSEQMPPYGHIKGETLSALLFYLKSL
jgi:mono/diheme cytochrome c family protein